MIKYSAISTKTAMIYLPPIKHKMTVWDMAQHFQVQHLQHLQWPFDLFWLTCFVETPRSGSGEENDDLFISYGD